MRSKSTGEGNQSPGAFNSRGSNLCFEVRSQSHGNHYSKKVQLNKIQRQDEVLLRPFFFFFFTLLSINGVAVISLRREKNGLNPPECVTGF